MNEKGLLDESGPFFVRRASRLAVGQTFRSVCFPRRQQEFILLSIKFLGGSKGLLVELKFTEGDKNLC